MDAKYRTTSLSAGLIIFEALQEDEKVKALTTKIFPVVSEEGATLPYICYRRGGLDDVATKSVSGADTVQVDVMCYSADYAGGVRIAEAVREALDGTQIHYTNEDGADLIARSVRLVDSEEGWQDDAYVQALTFSMKI